MHQIIYALVTASTTDQALSRTADVFDQHYVTVDDTRQRSPVDFDYPDDTMDYTYVEKSGTISP
ncbi:hypothetical protein C9J85_18560 [Haloferax sp. wsp5]|nr:hypothetical protein C9J85_18560 [Haloferax sp. wsp5]